MATHALGFKKSRIKVFPNFKMTVTGFQEEAISGIKVLDSRNLWNSFTFPFNVGRIPFQVHSNGVAQTDRFPHLFIDLQLVILFIDRYNLDPVNEKPLRGRYEWVSVEGIWKAYLEAGGPV
ncbi:hypothetical protein L1987_64227 [Smallanthus sonchifolius]|uniref:Uncharacterized protein n=1 Tax=Smallanthus sonchifolius TaxID=185202 RepID=A0ACB9CFH0_9ASTR|nr:hypothetical protein L1987_64227 [Smallanthus sonchifolius]